MLWSPPVWEASHFKNEAISETFNLKKWEKHTTGTCNAQNQYYNYSTKRLNEATQRDNCLLPVPHYHDDLGKQSVIATAENTNTWHWDPSYITYFKLDTGTWLNRNLYKKFSHRESFIWEYWFQWFYAIKWAMFCLWKFKYEICI